MEFLGHLIVNSGVLRCIALTSSRQERVLEMIDEWAERGPESGYGATAEPRELARFLGHLVFVSEVVPGGRAYMQALLRQFQGLEVDWARRSVRYVRSNSPWGRVPLSRDFWGDLVWFLSSLSTEKVDSPVRGCGGVRATRLAAMQSSLSRRVSRQRRVAATRAEDRRSGRRCARCGW